MATYTITLTAAEDAALSYAALSQQEWIDNAVHARCHVAIDEIVTLTVQKCLESNIQIPSSKDDMVTLAFEQQWVTLASERIIEPMVMPEVGG